MGVRSALEITKRLFRFQNRLEYLSFVRRLEPFSGSDHSSFLEWRDAAMENFDLSDYEPPDTGRFYRLLKSLRSEKTNNRLPWGGIVIEEESSWFRRKVKKLLLLEASGYLLYRPYPEPIVFEVRSGYGLLIFQGPQTKKRKVEMLSAPMKFWELPAGTCHGIIALTPLIIEDPSGTRQSQWESAIQITRDAAAGAG